MELIPFRDFFVQDFRIIYLQRSTEILYQKIGLVYITLDLVNPNHRVFSLKPRPLVATKRVRMCKSYTLPKNYFQSARNLSN